MSAIEGPTPVAIIGFDCRLPGAANPSEYWRLLKSGQSALGELPPEKLNRELYFAAEKGVVGKTYSTVGGVVPARKLCPEDFGLDDTRFASTDVAFLSICDVAARALRDARLDPFQMPQRNVGVYIGGTGGSTSASDRIFATMIEETAGFLCELDVFRSGILKNSSHMTASLIEQLVRDVRRKYAWKEGQSAPDLSAHAAAHVISQAFGLTGPSLALDSACASSLQALVLGAQAIRQGQIDLAIVGGAACLKQYSLVLFSAAQSLTAGDSRPFDEDADGLVAAEGYVAMVLKRLDRAVADGDSIWGVVRGSGTASDGKGKSLWAPRKEGQMLAIQRAYQHGLQMRHLQYVEAHATSTQVGDATEIAALAESIGPQLAPGQRLPLGTSKGNIGHTLESAGIAGLAKVLLALKHRTIPPVAGVRRPNPKVDWQQLPFYLPAHASDWPDNEDVPRRAAVNSFGIGGLNTHLVVEEYLPTPRRSIFGGASPAKLPVDLRAAAEPMFEPIAVVGMGAILPGAFTLEALRDLLNSSRDSRREPPPGRWTMAAQRALAARLDDQNKSCLGGFLDGYQYDWKRNKIPPKQVAQGNPLQFMLLDAAADALRSAGYDRRPFDRRRTGVVVGSIFRGDFCNQLQMGLRLPEFNAHLIPLLENQGLTSEQIATVVQQYRDYLLQKMPALLDETGSFTSSTLASRITKAFDLMGGAVAIDSGNASGLAALGAAIDHLRTGDCEMIVCAAAHQAMDFCAYQALIAKGGRPTNAAARPFSRHHETTIPGEGVAVVLLKRLADARRDHDPVYAVIRGLAAATDMQHPARASEQAIRQALKVATITPSDLSGLELEGHAGPGEADDLEAIARVFGETPRKAPLPVRSLAGQTGYCGAAMATAGLVAASLQLAQNSLVPGAPVESPANQFSRHASTVCLVRNAQPFPQAGAGSPPLIGILAGGGTGSSYFAVLERGDAIALPTSRAMPESVEGPQAIAVVPETESERRFLPTGESRPRIAWLFPGQGSQYAGMLKDLAAQHPPAAAAIAEADALLESMGFESFTEIAWNNSAGLGSDIWKTQLSMLVADYVVASSLYSLGLKPDVVAGHSLGELPALLAAGAWTLEDAIRATWERADAQRRSVDRPAGMLAIFAPVDTVQELLDRSQRPVFIANHNAPEQLVVGGARTDIEHVATLARQRQINTTVLPVPCAFHTPLMQPAAGYFAAGLAKISLKMTHVPVISTATNRAMVDPADFRDSMIASMTAPVPYVDMIRRLDAEAPTLFVEVGPQRVLTKLNQKILGADRPHTWPTDDSQRPGLGQLAHVARLLMASDSSGSSPSRMRQIGETSLAPGRLFHFDATQQRRTSRRQESEKGPRSSPPAIEVATTATASAAEIAIGPGSNSTVTAMRDFLLRFVVEQTGYPEEMVDLDSNLEADLGIDSIKKAQMFGEIAEHFDVAAPSGPVSLDDFPTLRHVLDYLATSAPPVDASLRGEIPTDVCANDLASAADDSRPRERLQGGEPAGTWDSTKSPAGNRPEPTPRNGVQRAATSDESARTMGRFVFRMVDAPFANREAIAWSGRALVLGENADAAAIVAALRSFGTEVATVPIHLTPTNVADEIARLWKDGPIPHLFLVTPRDRDRLSLDDGDQWLTRRERGLLVPFAACQKWFQLVSEDSSGLQATLTGVTSMGGGFGFATPVVSAESGGIAGLVKAVGVESRGSIRVKVVDFASPYEPAWLAQDLLAELSWATGDIEVGYDERRRRHVVRGVYEPASTLAPVPIPARSVWIVTGGARGVTAAVARALGRRFGLKLHLLGSSQLSLDEPGWRGLSRDQWKDLKADVARRARERGESPSDAWDRVVRSLELDVSLREFAEAGIAAEYHTCDVSSFTELSHVVAQIRQRDGAITGIIHGAGVEYAASFAKKRLESVEKTLAVKVDGAAHLMRLLDDQPPQYFVGFSSVSGRFGGFGQTDYSMANDLLCKLVRQFSDRHPRCRAVCLDWPAWDEIGMAARPESRFALQAMKVKFMRPAEGIDHLIDELQIQSSVTEVAIVEREGRTSGHISMRDSHAPREAKSQGSAPNAATTRPVDSPSDATAHLTASLVTHPREFGRRHRQEILAFLRQAADQLDAPDAPEPRAPACLRLAYDSGSDEILREVAAGAEVSLTSLVAHRPVPTSTHERYVRDLPLIETVNFVTQDELVAQIELRPGSDLFLRDHQLHKRPFLPAVGTAEILVEAASLLAPGLTLTAVRDFEILRGQSFVSDANLPLEVAARRTDRGIECELVVPGSKGRTASIILGKGIVEFASEPCPSPELAVGEPTYRWNPFSYAERGHAPVVHGTSMRTLSELSFQHDGGRAKLTARPPLELASNRRGKKWLTPSAVLDGCLVACGTYSFLMLEGRIELPRRWGCLRIYRQPSDGESCRCRFFLRDTNSAGSRYDFHLVGADGRCLASAEAYETTNLQENR